MSRGKSALKVGRVLTVAGSHCEVQLARGGRLRCQIASMTRPMVGETVLVAIERRGQAFAYCQRTQRTNWERTERYQVTRPTASSAHQLPVKVLFVRKSDQTKQVWIGGTSSPRFFSEANIAAEVLGRINNYGRQQEAVQVAFLESQHNFDSSLYTASFTLKKPGFFAERIETAIQDDLLRENHDFIVHDHGWTYKRKTIEITDEDSGSSSAGETEVFNEIEGWVDLATVYSRYFEFDPNPALVSPVREKPGFTAVVATDFSLSQTILYKSSPKSLHLHNVASNTETLLSVPDIDFIWKNRIGINWVRPEIFWVANTNPNSALENWRTISHKTQIEVREYQLVGTEITLLNTFSVPVMGLGVPTTENLVILGVSYHL